MKRACPCGGADYRTCCRPYHRGAEAPDPATLVRSRFSAFALGDGEYLWRTLHESHELRRHPKDAVVRDLRRAKHALRFRALTIDDVEIDGDAAHVLFFAKVMERGRDRSFVELSSFVRSNGTWRYVSGVLRPASAPRTIAAFRAIAG